MERRHGCTVLVGIWGFITKPSIRVLSLWMGAAACAAEPPPSLIDGPDETLYVGALSLVEGELRSASGLARWEPGQGLPLFVDRSAEHRLLGWTVAELAALGPLDDTVLRGTRLREAQGCAPPLPAPSWRARWAEDSPAPQVVGPELEIPPMTADWMSDRCESVADSRWMVETTCNPFGVFPIVQRSAGACERDLDLTSFELPSLRGRLWYDGRVCAEPVEPGSGCARDGARPGTLVCAGDRACRIDLSLSEVSEPPFSRMTAQLYPDLVPYADASFEGTREYRALRTHYGYARSMTVTPDSVWVAARRPAIEVCPNRRMEYFQFEFIELSKEDLTVVRTATAPTCVEDLMSDGTGGFFAVHAEADQNWIARYDSTGRQRLVRRLGSGPGDDVSDVQRLRTRVVERLPSGEVLVLLSADIRMESPNLPSQLLVLDPNTLEERFRLDRLGELRAAHLLLLGASEGVLSFHSTNVLQFFDVMNPEATRRVPFEHDPGQGTHGLGRFGAHLFLAAQSVLLVFDAETGELETRAPVSARPMTLIQAVPWMPDPRLMLILGLPTRGESPYVTLATLYDLETSRFRPTVFETGGHGVPHDVQPDGEGGYLILQPWLAQVTRIRPN